MNDQPDAAEAEAFFVSHSEQETDALGRLLAELLEPGMVVALVGNLGTGKTRLVQSVAAAMGIDRRLVSSPTFILVQEYRPERAPDETAANRPGQLPLERIFHIDAYRLRDSDEFLELGGEEIMSSDGVCLIEWADRVDDVLPEDHVRIDIEAIGETVRRFRIRGTGPRSNQWIAELSNRLNGR